MEEEKSTTKDTKDTKKNILSFLFPSCPSWCSFFDLAAKRSAPPQNRLKRSATVCSGIDYGLRVIDRGTPALTTAATTPVAAATFAAAASSTTEHGAAIELELLAFEGRVLLLLLLREHGHRVGVSCLPHLFHLLAQAGECLAAAAAAPQAFKELPLVVFLRLEDGLNLSDLLLAELQGGRHRAVSQAASALRLENDLVESLDLAFLEDTVDLLLEFRHEHQPLLVALSSFRIGGTATIAVTPAVATVTVTVTSAVATIAVTSAVATVAVTPASATITVTPASATISTSTTSTLLVVSGKDLVDLRLLLLRDLDLLLNLLEPDQRQLVERESASCTESTTAATAATAASLSLAILGLEKGRGQEQERDREGDAREH